MVIKRNTPGETNQMTNMKPIRVGTILKTNLGTAVWNGRVWVYGK